MLMKRRLIIIGLFWEDSLCIPPLLSLFLYLHFFLFSVCTHAVIHVNRCCCCCCCEHAWVCQWRTERVYVRMTKTYKTFCNELFKRLLPFERWVCVYSGWACQVCECAFVCICVCVQYVLSLHLTSFESDVGGGKNGTVNWSAENWRLS